MAYFSSVQIVQIAAATGFPALGAPIFAMRWIDMTFRIDALLHEMSTQAPTAADACQFRKYKDMMHVPLLYAIDYRVRNIAL